jgi:CRP-like cAMP-binding protein
VDQALVLLARTELFSSLAPDALRSIAAEAHERRYAKGEAIFREGDPGDAFFVVAEGTVKVFVTSERGDEMVLATLRPPEALGEVSLLDGGPRSASAEAIDAVAVLAIARSTLFALIQQERTVADAMLRASGGLLRRLTGQAADLVFLDLEGRVAKLLVGMAERRGERRDGGVALELGLTQGDLGAMVGGSRQSVNQILRALSARGFLEVHGREIVILDEAALRRRGGI